MKTLSDKEREAFMADLKSFDTLDMCEDLFIDELPADGNNRKDHGWSGDMPK